MLQLDCHHFALPYIPFSRPTLPFDMVTVTRIHGVASITWNLRASPTASRRSAESKSLLPRPPFQSPFQSPSACRPSLRPRTAGFPASASASDTLHGLPWPGSAHSSQTPSRPAPSRSAGSGEDRMRAGTSYLDPPTWIQSIDVAADPRSRRTKKQREEDLCIRCDNVTDEQGTEVS